MTEKWSKSDVDFIENYIDNTIFSLSPSMREYIRDQYLNHRKLVMLPSGRTIDMDEHPEVCKGIAEIHKVIYEAGKFD